MWLDVRAARLASSLSALGFAPAQEQLEQPNVKRTVLDLVNGLREKFDKIGVPQPKGRVVDAVLVDAPLAGAVIEDVRDLGLSVYTASRDIDGVKLPDGAFFVCDASTKMPVGALSSAPLRFTAAQRLTALDVWRMVPKEEPSEAEVEAKEEAMRQYREGLDDESRYVPPPPSRIRELMGFSSEDDCLPVTQGQVLAKTLPPDPLLWARALMQRRKEVGSGVPAYSLRSDREAAARARAAVAE